MEEVRVLDDNEKRAHQHDGVDGVKYAVLQLCAEVRGLTEMIEAVETQRRRERRSDMLAKGGF